MAGERAREITGFDGGIAAAGNAIIGDARAALAHSGGRDAETVHDIRKALKRWRALMRLLAGPIGDEANASRLAARELMRSISGARDAQAALDALADLGKAESQLSARTLKTLEDRLTAGRAAAEAGSVTPAMRARFLAFLVEAEQALALMPLDRVDFAALTAALTATYRRARQLIPSDWADAEAEHLHDLRRRVVEHRHQMDLVEPLWPRLGRLWGEEAQRLRNQLGACQDLAVLEAFTAPRQPLARWRTRLKPAIDARRADHLDTAARLAGRLFAEKPKAFRRRIMALHAADRPKAV